MGNFQKIDILMPVGEKGGVENVVSRTALYLMEKGYQVRVVQLIWENVRWVPEEVAFYPLLQGRGHYSLDRFVEQYTQFYQEHGTPDLILATTWPVMVLVAKLTILALPQAHCKIVSWLHGPVEQYVRAGFGGMESLEKADAVFVLNQRTEAMLNRNPNCHNVSIVKNPVNFSRCPLQSQSSTGEPCLLFVGRISKEKRLDLILHALHHTKAAWRLRIIGDGEDRQSVEKLVQNLALEERVEFCGWMENPWEHTDGISATVLASEYECFPMVAVESLACGIPVIAPPVDGITELIESGRNGFLYAKGGFQALTKTLDSIASGEVPEILSETCRQSVADFEESKVLADFEEKLADVLDKISVIIPCYNVQDRVAACLDSVFGQQAFGANLEVICVDDKSTDDTVRVLKQYEEKYSENMLLILLEQNGRQGNARNIGMQYASGNYICFVDADDLVDSRMLKSLYQKAVETRCDVVECAYRLMQWGDQPEVEQKGQLEYYDMQNMDQKKAYIMKYGWKTGPWGRLYRWDFLSRHQICFLTDRNMEDIYFSELCMAYMKSYVRIPETYYFYCENGSGIMHSQDMIHYYMDTAIVQIDTTERLMQEGCLSGCEEEYAYLHFSKAFVEPINRMRKNEAYFSYENFVFLKDSLFHLFPDIMENSYFLRDQSQSMGLYRTLLERDWTEEELQHMLQAC